MVVDMGQVLMLTLAVPAVCLLLVVLTQVETWLLQHPGPRASGRPGTGAGEGRQDRPMLAVPGAVDAATARQATAGEEDTPSAAPPGGMSQVA